MLKITIEGPQGTGKTLLAEALREILAFSGKVALVRDADDGWVQGAMVENPDAIIETKTALP